MAESAAAFTKSVLGNKLLPSEGFDALYQLDRPETMDQGDGGDETRAFTQVWEAMHTWRSLARAIMTTGERKWKIEPDNYEMHPLQVQTALELLKRRAARLL